MAEDKQDQQPAPVDGLRQARAILTEKDGVLEGNPDTVAENAKSATGSVAPEGQPNTSAEEVGEDSDEGGLP